MSFDKKIQLPGALNYRGHWELVVYILDSFERLEYEYLECKKKNSPFIIYTDYWHANNNPKTKEILKEIYNYAIEDGAKLVALSECF